MGIMIGGNFMKNRFAVILAAGQGTRMKSKLSKVLHPILGRSMIDYIIKGMNANSIDTKVTVVGHGAEEVMSVIGNQSEFVIQKEQLGTAHAVMKAEEILKDRNGTTIIVYGDTPLISSATFEKLFQYHESTGSTATILTTKVADPFGYGRVIRDEEGHVERIVEQKDANEEEKEVNEINTGTYCFDNQALFSALKEVGNDNAQGEYYLTDVIEILRERSCKVSAFLSEDADETIGINDRVALVQAENIMKRKINETHLLNGVTIVDPEHTYIGPDVTIEQDVTVYPGCIILGETYIETGSTIGPHTEINDCTIGKYSVIRQSVLKNSKIGNEVQIGPFAHIRPDNNLGDKVKVGNFVELKKAEIGEGTKVPHLSYIGDANLGSGINIGCGAITVNYDGVDKHVTNIGDNAFIGCNVNLIAPVTVEKGAFVAAGSTINRDVPEDALAIGRARQTNKDGYANKMKQKK